MDFKLPYQRAPRDTHVGEARVRAEPFESLELELGVLWEDSASRAALRPAAEPCYGGLPPP